jgi:hypothetical protein
MLNLQDSLHTPVVVFFSSYDFEFSGVGAVSAPLALDPVPQSLNP